MAPPLDDLEAVLGYAFRDRRLLEQALTHPSNYETTVGCNERLEFLGDAVLQLVVSELLFRLYPEEREGLLTHKRAALVKGPQLARKSRQLELEPHLRFGPSEDGARKRGMSKALADVLEAIIGAVFLDGGLDAARGFIEAHWRDELDRGLALADVLDPVTVLQEIVQEALREPPRFITVAEHGPDHEKHFEIAATILGCYAGRGAARSKREAKKLAAKQARGFLQDGMPLDERDFAQRVVTMPSGS